MNIRKCKQCGKMIDFDEPWCDHETMEESAWRDIDNRIYETALNQIITDLVHQAARDLEKTK